MQITAKVLQGKEYSFEVQPHDTVSFIKETIERHLHVPIVQQRLILKGRALTDTQSVEDAKIVEGDKIFVMVKKVDEQKVRLTPSEPEHDVKMWTEMWQFLLRHFTVDNARKVMAEYIKNYRETIAGLSLDDIERLARAKQDNS